MSMFLHFFIAPVITFILLYFIHPSPDGALFGIGMFIIGIYWGIMCPIHKSKDE